MPGKPQTTDLVSAATEQGLTVLVTRVDTWIPRPELGPNVATQVPAGEQVPPDLADRPRVSTWPPQERP